MTSIQQQSASDRPFIVPIFLPHAGCPHQCVFCNQYSITGKAAKAVNSAKIRSQIQHFLKYKKDGRKPIQISFYGGNFLGLETAEIKTLLDQATEFVKQGQVDSIRFSTRPDTITSGRIDILQNYPVESVELGVQSMDDRVLALARRGHCAADTTRAVELLKERGYSIGLQMMVGLPGDTEAGSLLTAKKIAALEPDFVRIYPTIVINSSQLAKSYQEGTYTPLSLGEAVTQVKNLYLFFKKQHIKVIRMGLQASDDLAEGSTVLAGPHHPAFGHLVYSEIFCEKALAAIASAGSITNTLIIRVHQRSISKMRGLKNSNIKKLKQKFKFEAVEVWPDDSMTEEEVKIH